ncbi:UNVERIFIED_CONTAM: hypothetical protein PYX00_006717 [Menopon gallinae]|uniref:Uncharacterized protein n=1 Tax=Menopon gallinae TaxID=328185 RepID=A0AAW2HX29_9NEOP
MLTRREKLLVRPWQLRRYNNHRKKVLTALPVIDFGPPPQRGHVTLKLKKLQKEGERRTKIEEDNFRLLQRMGAIMKKNRLDNYWETEPPNFLRRVGIYHRTRSPTPCEELTPVTSPRASNTRKSRCLACSAEPEKPKIIPEERVPWEPPKKSPSNRRSSITTTTTVVIKTADSSSGSKNDSSRSNTTSRAKTAVGTTEAKSSCLPYIDNKKYCKTLGDAVGRRIVLEQGSLHLAVNFPIYVDVKVKSAKGEKYIQRGYCGCQALSRNKHKSVANV